MLNLIIRVMFKQSKKKSNEFTKYLKIKSLNQTELTQGLYF